MRRWRRMLALAACAIGLSTGVVMAQPASERGDAPIAALIDVSAPDADGLITLEGRTGAAFPGAFLAIRNLYTGELAFTQAGLTGTFLTRLRGVEGNPFAISPSTSEFETPDYAGSLPGGPAAIVTAPRLTEPNAFAIAGELDDGQWQARGDVSALEVEPGDEWALGYTLTLDDNILINPAAPLVCERLLLTPAFLMQDGVLQAVSAADAQNGWSSRRTRSGAGIIGAEAPLELGGRCSDADLLSDIVRDGSAALDNAIITTLDDSLAPGLYVPSLEVSLRQTTVAGPAVSSITRLPLVVRVGVAADEPAILPAALFWDNPSDGSRGLLPQGSPYTLVNRVRFDAPTYILPPGQYPLEPYLLNLLPNRFDRFSAPLLPLDLPGGSLTVTVIAPDNTQTRYSTSITQLQQGLADRDDALSFGRQSPIDTARTTSDEPALAAFAFDQYGEYAISVDLTLTDVQGGVYVAGGDVHLTIAEPLDITPAVLPGAPLVTGGDVAIGAHIVPAVPADIAVTLTTWPLRGRSVERRWEGAASPFGLYLAETGPYVAEQAGEYAATYEARYTDAQGRLWAGSLSALGVIVEPDGELIAHGLRGITGASADDAAAWYAARQAAEAAGLDPENVRVGMPYQGGDLALIGADAGDGFAPGVRLQDAGGRYAAWLVAGGAPADSAYRGELPVQGDRSYAIVSVVRPGVTVRQFAAEGNTSDLLLEADSDDPVNRQIGAGFDGLLAGDVLFFFGGAVVREPDAGVFATAATASAGGVIVTQPDDPPRDPDGVRVFAAGQPGAVVAFGSEQLPLFGLSLGVSPGDIVPLDTPVLLAGQVGPPLPANVAIVITSPSGQTRSARLTANAYGYYIWSDGGLFDEPGAWTIQVRFSYDGLVSNGALEQPISGGLLGASGSAYHVYVTPEDAAPLAWNPALADSIIPAALPYNFTFTAPDDWTDVRAFETLTMPGYVLQDAEQRLTGRSLSPQYNPVTLSRAFPNVEVEGRVDGPQASDPVLLTLVFTGLNAQGEPAMRYGQFAVLHDRLINLAAGS